MLTRIYGKHVFECDACGETLETGTKDFRRVGDHAGRKLARAGRRQRLGPHLRRLCHEHPRGWNDCLDWVERQIKELTGEPTDAA